MILELGRWLVDTVHISECPFCMDPVVGVRGGIFVHSRVCIVLMVVVRSYTGHALIAHFTQCNQLMTAPIKESVPIAINDGLQICQTSQKMVPYTENKFVC